MSCGSCRLRFAGALVALLALGCGPERPPLAFETAHFVVYSADPTLDPEAIGPWYEAHEAMFDSLTGLGVPDAERVEVWHFLDDSVIRGECAGANNCVPSRGRVLTVDHFHGHENVHAYLGFHVEQSNAAFAEGAAEVFGSVGRSGVVTPTEDIRRLLAGRGVYDADVEQNNYAVAASFVRYLIDTHGVDAFFTLYRATRHDDSLARLDERMRATLDDGLDASIEGWLARGPRRYSELVFRELECGTPRLPREATSHELRRGPRVWSVPTATYLGAVRSLEPTTATPVRFELSSARRLTLVVGRCDEGDEGLALVDLTRAPSEVWTALDAGRHYAMVGTGWGPPDEGDDTARRAEAVVGWQESPALLGRTCAEVEPVDAASVTEVVLGPSALDRLGACGADGCEIWLSFSSAPAYEHTELEEGQLPVRSIRWCDGCDDATCIDVPASDPLPEWEGAVRVRVRSDPLDEESGPLRVRFGHL